MVLDEPRPHCIFVLRIASVALFGLESLDLLLHSARWECCTTGIYILVFTRSCPIGCIYCTESALLPSKLLRLDLIPQILQHALSFT